MTSLARGLGTGLVAGAAGTALMTAAQYAEMRVTGRPTSTTPGQFAAMLLRRNPRNRREAARLTPAVHTAYGLTMGGLRGLLGPGASRSLAHFALLWSGDALLYKATGIADWPWRWSRRDWVADLVGKGTYAVGTSLVHDRLATR